MTTYYPKERSLRSNASFFSRLVAALPSGVAVQLQRLWDRQIFNPISTSPSKVPKALRHVQQSWSMKRLLNLPNLFITFWTLLLLWGERWVFENSIAECKWGKWEKWPRDATPHHLIFLADPQLIDPHSYPGRPWPLSTFTFWHTDNYLKRNYIQLQKQLHPDTVFFLGDLFDGGREWKTAHGNTVDPAWANGQRPSGEAAYLKTWGKRYGEDFWLHEYDRFGRIFYKFWDLAGAEPGVGQRGRKIISSLPGNHDLGFGDKIKIPIRNRFETYFGQGNRVDVIANHTFVSVDSVSLSAGGLPHATEELVRPVENFLQEVQALKRKAVARELRFQNQVDNDFRYSHIVEEAATANYQKIPTMDPGKGTAEFPTILLTHVPLYRKPGTPCGPKREHWPPATPPKGQFTPVFPDHRNAISISGGYQYQNVLTEDHSVKLVSAVGNVGLVFSGDDHDYCEIVHPENKNNAREITVKSISWAMGVRRPGFVMLSMWNPVSPNGELLHSAPTGHGAGSQTAMTVETHLCLQPDQLGIFMRYGFLIVITILTISIRAMLTPILNLTPFSNPYTTSEPTPLLPTSAKDFKRHSSLSQDSHSSNSSTSSTTSAPGLAPRTTASRTRSVSPVNGYAYSPQAQPPLINHAHNAWSDKKEEDKYSLRSFGEEAEKKRRPLTGGALVWKEMWTSLWRVGWVALTVYLYLVYFG